ncbi:hypothetical protein Taro_019441 [Colocasia esculenta]|uniref:Uncharacterized protein n=1 Tax=Colocasia esculenta TaxID=4460 RepID=A0A843UTU0_COLES|nr:hypothetical protein [Colocasia esculenta]
MAASGSSDSVGGYSVTFLTADQQNRFTAVKIKLCGNKAVDIEDLEKHGMHIIVEAIQRMKWLRLVTVSEPSYPDLAKAFYTYLKTEEDGSLSSSVKGTPIHITYDLLERLFGVSTVGQSGVDTVDIHAKGIFKHYGIDLKGEVMEKMGQPIRSRNLKKSGFSLVRNVWTKTSVAEGEEIIGGASEIPIVQEEEAEVRVEEPVAVVRRIEEIAPKHIEPVG